MSESVINEPMTTPTNGVVSPPVSLAPDPVPVAEPPPAPEPPPVVVPSRDFEAELAQKDRELKTMETKLSSIEGASKEAQDERQRMVVEVAKLINEREAIEQAKETQLQQKNAELEQVSQATQTLNQKTQTLEQQLQERDRALAAEKAKSTKLEVLTQEFPNLLRYAQFIPASSDPAEVRGHCLAFQQARESDLSDYRQVVSGAVRPVPTGTPVTRMPDSGSDAEQLEQRLTNAMGDQSMFEAELQAAIANYRARQG